MGENQIRTMQSFGGSNAAAKTKEHVVSAEFDAKFKQVFSNKKMLAVILRGLIPEYKGMSILDVV